MERSAPLCYWGLAVCREGCEPETSDTDGCCARAQFLFCCCVTGKLRGKSSPASSGAFPTTSCSTAVSCLWLLIFFTAWPGCCPHAGCLMEARAVKHTLSIPAHVHLPEFTFFNQFLQCSHDLEQGLGPWYACGKCLLWYLFPTWKKGVEGSVDSIPLKCNVLQSLLLSLLVMAGHHYS